MDITFEQIKKANEIINTTNIKGKEYAEVNQRIKAFRMVYPTGAIETELISNENGLCIFRATVSAEISPLDGQRKILGTGTAYEKEGSSFINKSSYIENCETSAIGRALGMAGFGIDTSVASAEEVQNAIEQQEDLKLITKTQINVLQGLIKELPNAKEFYETILEKYKIKDLADLTVKQHGEILIKIKDIRDKERINEK